MRKPPFILILAATLLLALPVLAEEDEGLHVERQVKIKMVKDGDLLELDLSDMEVGDTQQFFTESGKEVLVTRTEDAYKIAIDGEEEAIVLPVREGDNAFAFATGDEGEHVVIRKRIVKGDCDDGDSDCAASSMVFVAKDGKVVMEDVTGDASWVAAGAHAHAKGHAVRLHHKSAAQRLIESGVLDDLPEAKRKEILDALKSGEEGEHMVVIETEVSEEKEKNDN